MAAPADDFPWRDKEKLAEAYAEHGSLAGVAQALGCGEKTIYTWWRKHKLPRMAPGPNNPAGTSPNARISEDAVGMTEFQQLISSHIQRKGKKVQTVTELADLLDVAPKVIRAEIPSLRKQGLRIDETDGGRIKLSNAPPPSARHFTADKRMFDGDIIRFGQVSDTHLSSSEEMVDELHTAYDVFADEGIEVVYHAGDLVAGRGIYRHQDTDLKHHTFKGQVNHAIENYPQRDGIVTKLIGGNHDLEGEFGRLGADPVQAVCHEREDMEYYGAYEAYFDLPNGGSICQLHPIGGRSYAISYRGQRLVAEMEGGAKPSALVLGHLHARVAFRSRNVEVLYAGCFEGQTSLGKRIPGDPATGFHIVEATLADDGSLVKWLPTWYAFYRGRIIDR